MEDKTLVDRQGVTRLADWGLIRAHGVDAMSFLQSQLTQDMASVSATRASLAGYCSAKGRLLASFWIWRPAADEFLMACSADLLPATLKRLSMFVLRAKCKLSDASAELPLFGVLGARPSEAIALPDVQGTQRSIVAGEAPALPALDAASWSWLEVASGVPRIVAATVDQFVPQMVNLELVDGVSFQKGCYPGQEVVARSQYRGTLKRRAFVFSAPEAARPGQEIFHGADRDQPAGMVANAASLPGHHLLLAEVKLAALDGAALRLGSADGPVLERAAMPYRVPLEQAA